MNKLEHKVAMMAARKREEEFRTRVIDYIKVRYRKSTEVMALVMGAMGLSSQAGSISRSSGSKISSGTASTGSTIHMGFQLIDDPATNTIIVFASKKTTEKIRSIVAKLDISRKQVIIEARIVEARTSFSRELGVNWSGSFQTQHNPWGSTGDGTYDYNFSTNFAIPTSTRLGINFINTAATKLLNAQIAFAETEGNVKTLSAPRIMTRDTVKASIKQGTSIVLPSGTDSNGNKTFQLVDATLKLEVTPQVTSNNKVNMKIDVSDDFPDYANARGENVPINTKNAHTEMMIASGDTVVIGGIYKEDKSSTEEGTPWLRNLPFLGWLFKTNSKTDARSELLIFLTPTVVSTPSKL